MLLVPHYLQVKAIVERNVAEERSPRTVARASARNGAVSYHVIRLCLWGARQDVDRDGRRFGSLAPGPGQDIENGRNLLQVSQGLRTTRERWEWPISRHGSKTGTKGAAVLTPLPC
jgi:hypothetical protein